MPSFVTDDIEDRKIEPLHFTSALGGYGQNKEQVYSEIVDAQLACVPEQIQAEIRQGTEFLTDTCIENFNIVYKPKSLSTKKNQKSAPTPAPKQTYSQIASPKPPHQERTPSPMEQRKRYRNPSPAENQPTRKRSPCPTVYLSSAPKEDFDRYGRGSSPAPRLYRSTSDSSMPPRRRSPAHDHSPIQYRRKQRAPDRRRSSSRTPTPPGGWTAEQEYQHEMNRYCEREDRRRNKRQPRPDDHTTQRTRLSQRLDFTRRERSVTPDGRYSRFHSARENY